MFAALCYLIDRVWLWRKRTHSQLLSPPLANFHGKLRIKFFHGLNYPPSLKVGYLRADRFFYTTEWYLGEQQQQHVNILSFFILHWTAKVWSKKIFGGGGGGGGGGGVTYTPHTTQRWQSANQTWQTWATDRWFNPAWNHDLLFNVRALEKRPCFWPKRFRSSDITVFLTLTISPMYLSLLINKYWILKGWGGWGN